MSLQDGTVSAGVLARAELALVANMQGLCRQPREFYVMSEADLDAACSAIFSQVADLAEQGNIEAKRFLDEHASYLQPPKPKEEKPAEKIKPAGAGPLPRKGSGKLRVGFTTPGLMIGGAEQHILSLLRSCDKDAIEFCGVGVTTHNLLPESREIAEMVCPVWQGPQAIQKVCESADVVISWGDAMTPTARYLKESDSKAKLVLTIHGECDWTTNILRRTLQFLEGKPPHVVAVGRSSVGPWVRTGGKAEDVTILHNGVDMNRLELKRDRREIRREWGVRDDEIVLGFCGRVYGEKRPEDVARAARVMNKLHNTDKYRAVMVGPMQGAGQLILKENPLTIFRPPVVYFGESIGDVYNAFDCFMLLSKSEGFGLAITEAWAMGVPAVVSPVGAVPELEEMYGPLTVRCRYGSSDAEIIGAVSHAMSPGNLPVIERAKQITRQFYTGDACGRRWTSYLRAVANA